MADAIMTCEAVREGDGRRLILLADHDAAFRRLVASFLEGESYEVIEIADGCALLVTFDAVLTVRHQRADSFLVIAHGGLPGLTGLDVLGIIRCAGWTTPVILVSTAGDEAMRAQGSELGAAAVLEETFKLHELWTAVVETMPPG